MASLPGEPAGIPHLPQKSPTRVTSSSSSPDPSRLLLLAVEGWCDGPHDRGSRVVAGACGELSRLDQPAWTAAWALEGQQGRLGTRAGAGCERLAVRAALALHEAGSLQACVDESDAQLWSVAGQACFRRHLHFLACPPAAAPTPECSWATTKTFEQRYFFCDEHWAPGGAIFFYLGKRVVGRHAFSTEPAEAANRSAVACARCTAHPPAVASRWVTMSDKEGSVVCIPCRCLPSHAVSSLAAHRPCMAGNEADVTLYLNNTGEGHEGQTAWEAARLPPAPAGGSLPCLLCKTKYPAAAPPACLPTNQASCGSLRPGTKRCWCSRSTATTVGGCRGHG